MFLNICFAEKFSANISRFDPIHFIKSSQLIKSCIRTMHGSNLCNWKKKTMLNLHVNWMVDIMWLMGSFSFLASIKLNLGNQSYWLWNCAGKGKFNWFAGHPCDSNLTRSGECPTIDNLQAHIKSTLFPIIQLAFW